MGAANAQALASAGAEARRIGEKMARAMICAFLGVALPTVDADVRGELPDDGCSLHGAARLRVEHSGDSAASTPAGRREPQVIHSVI